MPCRFLAVGLAITVAYAGENSVETLNRKLQDGSVKLTFDGTAGYLRSTLAALNIPVESQMLVFSKTSLMQHLISPQNPRSIFFNDSVIAGWVRHEPFVELAVKDDEQGLLFYTLNQQPQETPVFLHGNGCRSCHESYSTVAVPRLIVRSVFPATNGAPVRQLGEFLSDHRSPFHERWGGWYVTGNSGALRHMGNSTVADAAYPERPKTTVRVDSLEDRFDTSAYLSPHSDVVALLVFEHQIHLMNLLSNAGLDLARGPGLHLRDAAHEIADYMLFLDETPLAGQVQGMSGFAEVFAARGPLDAKGRSLRQFDLKRRLMRYPCSYMIYSQAFEGLPQQARDAIYLRMWQILSGEEKAAKYARLSSADRQAIVEILRETKPGLPAYFQPVRR